MAHDHSHHHHHHDSVGNIKIAFFLNLIFAGLELVGGLLTNSLAITSDALHDFGDSLSLGLSWYFEKISKKKRTGAFTYGLGRFSLLSALITSIVLLCSSIYVLSEAIPRLFHPEETNAQGMILFAIFGVAVNGIAAFRMRGGHSLNEKAVFLHMLEDILGWVAVLITGMVMLFWDFPILDPLLSILIVIYVLTNIFRNLKTTIKLFLQGAPDLDINEIEEHIRGIEHVKTTHDTHVWTLDGEHHVLTTHIVVYTKTTDAEIVQSKKDIKEILKHHNIQHTTIEVEKENEICDQENC